MEEINIHMKIDHPNIVRCLGTIVWERCNYIVTDYCEKGDLLKAYPEIKHDLIAIFIQMIEALEFLHSKGIIHRDIKIENFFITENNTVKLGDFGFATVSDFKSAVGTFSYMCPQIRINEGYTTKCDIWSLGIVFYLLTAGPDSSESLGLLDKLQLITPQSTKSKTKKIRKLEKLIENFEILDQSPEMLSLIKMMLKVEEQDRIDLLNIKNKLKNLSIYLY
jgi:serine/threonine protein kinase